MKKLADHIRLAHDDALDVHTTSKKISDRFRKIEAVELEHPQADVLEVLEGE
jgi:DNA recombination protein RmuC